MRFIIEFWGVTARGTVLRCRAKRQALAAATKTFSPGQNLGPPADLIFRSLMQRACHPPQTAKTG